MTSRARLTAFAAILAVRVSSSPLPPAAPEGPAGRVQELIGLLRSEDPAERFDAVGELSTLGRAALPAVGALAERIDDQEADVRIWSVKTLRILGPDAAPAVPALLRGLDDRDDGLREAILDTLTEIGESAGSAIPRVAQLLEDPGERIREAAGWTLLRIGAPADIAPQLVAQIGKSAIGGPAHVAPRLGARSGENDLALRLIFKIGRPALEPIAARLREADDETSRVLLQVAAGIDGEAARKLRLERYPPPTPAEFVAALRGKDRDRQYWDASEWADIEWAGSAKETVPMLLSLGSKHQDLVGAVLVRIGLDAVPLLIEALRRPAPWRDFSLVFLGIGVGSIPALALALDDEKTRLPAALTLGTMARHERFGARPTPTPYEPDGADAGPFRLAAPSLRAHARKLVPELIAGLRDATIASQCEKTLITIGGAAVPRLKRLVRDKSIGRVVVNMLGEIGPEAASAVPALAPLLAHPEAYRAHGAASTLARLGPRGVATLRAAFAKRQTRFVAAVALATTPDPPQAILPVLKEASRGKERALAEDAFLAMGEPAFAFLVAAARAGDREAVGLLGPLASRARAWWARAARTPAWESATKRATQGVASALREALANPTLRAAAGSSLGALGSDAVPDLTRAMMDEDADIRRTVVDILAAIGPGARAALIGALSDRDPRVRAAAARTLGDGRFGAAATPLAAALRNADLADCPTLATFLGAAARREHAPTEAFSALLEKLRVQDCSEAAQKALAEIGPASVGHVLPLLGDPDDAYAWTAAHVLQLLGQRAKPAVPALLEYLKHDRTKLKAVEVLASIGSEAGAAAADLGRALDDPAIGWKAALALSRIGPPAIPALVAALRRDASREAAVVALGDIGPAAHESVPALRSLLASADPDLRMAVEVALGQIERQPSPPRLPP